MSGGAAGPKGFATRFVQLVVLVCVYALLWGVTYVSRDSHGALDTIVATGFLLLAGTLMSEIFEPLGVPHLTGYLGAGILAGPYVLHLIDHETVENLSQVNTLALALIAIQGGAELRLGLLKEVLRSLTYATVVQVVLVLVVMTGIFVAARPLMPFTRGLTMSAVFGIALMWGTLSVTRSPSALLGILAQTRPKGPVTTFSLAFILSSDIVVVVLLAAMLTIARPMVEPGATFSLVDTFRDVGHELLGSVALGTTLGLVLIVYCRFVGRQLLLVLLALGFGMSEMLRYLRFEALLTFMVAGFVVTNLSNQGEKLLHAIEKAGGIVFVLFFATAGAHLNIPLLKRLWVVTLVLAGSRMVISLIAHQIGSRLAGDPPVVRRWGWGSLISQAGLALGVAAVIERAFPTFGSPFRSLSLATVAINEMIGPILFKLSLDRAGESSKAPEAVRGDHGEAHGPPASEAAPK
jgi:Kef-type K+ transport system membrane component KefB